MGKQALCYGGYCCSTILTGILFETGSCSIQVRHLSFMLPGLLLVDCGCVEIAMVGDMDERTELCMNPVVTVCLAAPVVADGLRAEEGGLQSRSFTALHARIRSCP